MEELTKDDLAQMGRVYFEKLDKKTLIEVACRPGLFNSIKTCIFKTYAVINREKIYTRILNAVFLLNTIKDHRRGQGKRYDLAKKSSKKRLNNMLK